LKKNGNGRNGNRKNGQPEKSATKNKRFGKQGNTKLMCEITATEKQQRENGQRNIGLRENSATRIEKKGQHKIIV